MSAGTDLMYQAASRGARMQSRPHYSVHTSQAYGSGAGRPVNSAMRQRAYNDIGQANASWDSGNNAAFAKFAPTGPTTAGSMGRIAGQPGMGGAAPTGFGGGAPAAGGAARPGAAGGASTGFGGKLEGAYGKIIQNGGQILSPQEAAALTHSRQALVSRGTDNNIQSARMDAIRRGDTDGSSIGDTEARIRGAGTAMNERAVRDTKIELARENAAHLMNALGGGTGLMQAQGNLALAGRQMDMQQLQFLISAMKDGSLPPEALAAVLGGGR